MTYPSAGCRTCKVRRIKCDETLPTCRKCIKSGRICTRAKAHSFLTENHYASGHNKRPRGPRSSPTDEAALSTPTVAKLCRCPPANLETLAMTYYFQQHLSTPHNLLSISKSVPDDFLCVWTTGAKSIVLQLAFSSIALAVFARTQHHPPAAFEATRSYQHLLQIVKGTISSLDHTNIDSCLLAVFFMSRYENVTYHPALAYLETSASSQYYRSYSHHDGIFAILKTWKEYLSSSYPATDVIKHSRRGSIRSSLLRCLPIPDWMLDGTAFGEHGEELEYDRIVIRLANTRSQISALLKKKFSSPKLSAQACIEMDQLACSLETECIALEKSLRDWSDRLSQMWHPLDDADAKSLLSSNPTSTNTTAAYASVWAQYLASRMLILSTHLQLVDLLLAPSQPKKTTMLLEQLHDAASALASLMPSSSFSSSPLQSNSTNTKGKTQGSSGGGGRGCSALQTAAKAKAKVIPTTTSFSLSKAPYVASLLAWPLSIASSISLLRSAQLALFRNELAQCGRLLGDRVLELGEPDRWLRL